MFYTNPIKRVLLMRWWDFYCLFSLNRYDIQPLISLGTSNQLAEL
ncbi:hypothetical protein HMPREF3190_00962 [Umbribacter vaginalis]|nr:hypothetical protein HMPREF3190_00962 [Coriobacteriales bacterium DNF00809]